MRRRDRWRQSGRWAGFLMLAAAGGGPTLLGQAVQSPIVLSSGPTVVQIPLTSDVSRAGGLSNYARALPGDEQLYLVIEGLHADRPPGALYQVYLRPAGLATGNGIPLGSISFFGSRPAGVDGPARSISLNVTERLDAAGAEAILGNSAEIVISPRGSPAVDAHCSIEKIALYSQRL